ncbi:MAG TPA: hypothetical protein VM510_11005 [Caulifigura sp.]|jgi:hypothetical protein|nr:hypothetical protein [Caulifigura sp.]
MRGRASKKKSDSMDLLLDTICNTFGGVLFIALLVVMLVQTSPASREQLSSTNEPSIDQRRAQLIRELNELNDELQQLEAARGGQLRTLASLAPEEQKRLLDERRDKENRAQGLRLEQAGLEALLPRIANDISAKHAAADVAKADLVRAQTEVDRLEKELAAAKAAKVKELRTPLAKRPGVRREIAFVIQYGRLYVWHRYDSMGNRLGLNTEDFLVIGKSSEALETTPRPTRGVPITITPASRAELASVIRRFNRDRHYPAFVVRPDSYDDFEVVRDVAVELGFEYRLLPQEADSTLVDRGGSGGFVQ